MINFSDRLRELRKQREMTQASLAQKAGLHHSAIAHFETHRRKPSFNNLSALAKALNITVDNLMGIKRQETTGFRNQEKLSDKERNFIQNLIDVMIIKNNDE